MPGFIVIIDDKAETEIKPERMKNLLVADERIFGIDFTLVSEKF